MSHFGDPQFSYHATMTKIWGMAVLRLANADIFPFDYAAYADEISSYVKEIKEISEKSSVLKMGSLLNKIDGFKNSAQQLSLVIEKLLISEIPVSAQSVSLINTSLMKIERCFGNPEGIPNRPWFKHLIYAPKFTYAPEVLPGITEAVEDEDWERAQEQIHRLENAISKADEVLLSVLKQIK
jgi:N-acetylated-alpha-linked acidic dipeptidase